MTYSGGGYDANLGYNEETSWTVLADLHSIGLINKQGLFSPSSPFIMGTSIYL